MCRPMTNKREKRTINVIQYYADSRTNTIITVKPCIEITRIFFIGEKSGKGKIIDVNILFSMRQEVEDIEIDFFRGSCSYVRCLLNCYFIGKHYKRIKDKITRL